MIDVNLVDIVLVETSHPGNIGAAARAIKTMGFTRLVLVNPKFFPDPRAEARATTHAVDILEHARIVPTLSEAIADATCVIGTSAQSRHLPWPMVGPRELGPKVCAMVGAGQKVALVFGRERGGLYNEELQMCHFHVEIPTSPDCRALNLASAVQVLCYEVMMAMRDIVALPVPSHTPAPMADFDRMMDHLYDTLIHIRFLDPAHPRLLKERLRRLFLRAAPDDTEISILRGIFKAVKDAR
ncbi:MAG: RNA methyltransferase [Gammaproteobacteria bacterium]